LQPADQRLYTVRVSTIDTLIADRFPNLTRAQVYECLAYFEDHRGEIDVLVARQMSAP